MKFTNKQKIEKLRAAYEEVIWMAIRYADGRSTFAPQIVRDSIMEFQEVFPDWKPKEDHTIKPPLEEDLSGVRFKRDFLYDLFDPIMYL